MSAEPVDAERDAEEDRGEERRRREDVAEFRGRGDSPVGGDSSERPNTSGFAFSRERRRGQNRRVEPQRDDPRR